MIAMTDAKHDLQAQVDKLTLENELARLEVEWLKERDSYRVGSWIWVGKEIPSPDSLYPIFCRGFAYLFFIPFGCFFIYISLYEKQDLKHLAYTVLFFGVAALFHFVARRYVVGIKRYDDARSAYESRRSKLRAKFPSSTSHLPQP